MYCSGAPKTFYIKIRAFPTMHRFVGMRRDGVQSLVATPSLPPTETLSVKIFRGQTEPYFCGIKLLQVVFVICL